MRTWMAGVMIVACAAGLAVAGQGGNVKGPVGMSTGGGGYFGDRGAVTPQPAPVLDAATQAKVNDLYKKLDDVAAKAGPYAAYGVNSYGGASYTFPGMTKDQTEAMKQVQEIATEITRAWLGADVAAKAEEYQTKNADISKQFQEVQRDASLDAAAKQARFAEIRTQLADLLKQYQDAVGKQQAVRTEIQQRQMRRPGLVTLKGLLKLTDKEWPALEPKIEAVIKLQGELRTLKSRGAFVGTFYGGPKWQAPKGGTPEGDLITVLKGDKPAVDTVNSKLTALRKERTDAETKQAAELADVTKRLKAAQDALRELLTAQQEATLVIENVLD